MFIMASLIQGLFNDSPMVFKGFKFMKNTDLTTKFLLNARLRCQKNKFKTRGPDGPEALT